MKTPARWFVAIGTVSMAMFTVVCLGCGNGKNVRAVSSQHSESEEKELASSKKEPLPDEHIVTDKIEVKTSMGAFVVGLYGNDAPKTVANFLSYVDSGFYSGKIFHRVIPEFMVQGGGFDSALDRGQTQEPIKLETIPGLRHEPGIVSMARTSEPHSATSQFFVCVANAPQLNGGYAAFGKVLEGYDIVEAISKVVTKTVEATNGPMADVPAVPVVIESITRYQ